MIRLQYHCILGLVEIKTTEEIISKDAGCVGKKSLNKAKKKQVFLRLFFVEKKQKTDETGRFYF